MHTYLRSIQIIPRLHAPFERDLNSIRRVEPERCTRFHRFSVRRRTSRYPFPALRRITITLVSSPRRDHRQNLDLVSILEITCQQLVERDSLPIKGIETNALHIEPRRGRDGGVADDVAFDGGKQRGVLVWGPFFRGGFLGWGLFGGVWGRGGFFAFLLGGKRVYLWLTCFCFWQRNRP